MPDIKFNCLKCGTEIEAEATLAGKIIQCPGCRNAVKAPENLMAPGMILGGYELGMLLGKGGMGEVWLSTQDSMQRKVALKILSPSLSKDPELIARFINEMKMVAKLDHPGIVSAYEAGHANGLYFLATSYVDGKTLDSMLDSGTVFDEKDALSIARKVAESLLYAWDKHRILHRDIKPANIMIEEGGAVKLMDMGISKSLKDDCSITMTGFIVGTPYYMSPEQAKAEKDIDQRADIYSLGATLYHMLTGHLPYNATSTMGILARVISEQLTPVREINPKLSAKCDLLISKMMAKDRMERQESWQEVIDDIDDVLDDRVAAPVIAGASGNQHSKKAWLVKIATVVIAFCVVVTVMILISQGHKKKSVDSNDEELPSIVNEDIPEPAGMKESKPVRKHEAVPAVAVNKDAVPENKTVESHGSTSTHVTQPSPVKSELHATAGENPEKPDKGALFYSVILSPRLGLNEKERERLAPIVKDYFKELKQLRDNRPSRGFEFKENLGRINADMQKKAESVLTKEQTAKLMQLLDEKIKIAFRNYFSHPLPPPHSQNK
ncbi:MAG TPA: hypothetical protein DET40_00240 [Lentisphaeria bacterium]|nr:MAG: hypothetical protein A2X45_20240 [Lentisphaerae bacterium GWF2_50_93]HCE41961.1 hypothetical protein [Lentisphaeria bacterium]